MAQTLDTSESELSKHLRTLVRRHAMFSPGQTVVVGISGGPDSTALLHALAGLRDEWQLTLVGCHLNHGFRGAEAHADADYVRELCARLEVECRIASVDVPALQKRRHLSAQAAARAARHLFLRQCAAQVGAERIALAHTQDDRTETILLNLLRGSGLEGLAGFPPVHFPLVRPLYHTTRAQVEAYCARYELNPRHDSSNAKTTYRRNRVRLELLPTLRARFNPHVDAALLRMADLARDDNAYLEQSAAEALVRLLALTKSNQTPAGDTPNGLKLPLDALCDLPLALQRRVLRQAIWQVRGHLQDIGFEHIEKLLVGNVHHSVHYNEHYSKNYNEYYEEELPAADTGTVRVCRDQQHITIRKEPALSSVLDWQVTLNVPGRTIIAHAGVTMTILLCLPDELPDLLNAWKPQTKRPPLFLPSGTKAKLPTQVAIWTRASVSLPLVARSWRPGDRMRPRGLAGSKKIQDLFTDAKIPLQARGHIPLLTTDTGQGRILAVVGWRLDETTLFTTSLPWSPDTLLQWLQQQNTLPPSAQELQELIIAVWEYE